MARPAKRKRPVEIPTKDVDFLDVLRGLAKEDPQNAEGIFTSQEIADALGVTTDKARKIARAGINAGTIEGGVTKQTVNVHGIVSKQFAYRIKQ